MEIEQTDNGFTSLDQFKYTITSNRVQITPEQFIAKVKIEPSTTVLPFNVTLNDLQPPPTFDMSYKPGIDFENALFNILLTDNYKRFQPDTWMYHTAFSNPNGTSQLGINGKLLFSRVFKQRYFQRTVISRAFEKLKYMCTPEEISIDNSYALLPLLFGIDVLKESKSYIVTISDHDEPLDQLIDDVRAWPLLPLILDVLSSSDRQGQIMKNIQPLLQCLALCIALGVNEALTTVSVNDVRTTTFFPLGRRLVHRSTVFPYHVVSENSMPELAKLIHIICKVAYQFYIEQEENEIVDEQLEADLFDAAYDDVHHIEEPSTSFLPVCRDVELLVSQTYPEVLSPRLINQIKATYQYMKRSDRYTTEALEVYAKTFERVGVKLDE